MEQDISINEFVSDTTNTLIVNCSHIVEDSSEETTFTFQVNKRGKKCTLDYRQMNQLIRWIQLQKKEDEPNVSGKTHLILT